jgi:hypothetical protein
MATLVALSATPFASPLCILARACNSIGNDLQDYRALSVSPCVSSEKGEELCITYKHHQALTITAFSSLVSILTLELDDIFFLDRNECHLSVTAGATVFCSSGHGAQSQVLSAYEPVLLGYLHPLSRMVERLCLATRGSFRL